MEYNFENRPVTHYCLSLRMSALALDNPPLPVISGLLITCLEKKNHFFLMTSILMNFWLQNQRLVMSPPGVLGSVFSFMLYTGHAIDLSTLN